MAGQIAILQFWAVADAAEVKCSQMLCEGEELRGCIRAGHGQAEMANAFGKRAHSVSTI